MTTRTVGARIPRNEDPRLLQGRGCFVDDIQPAGVLHAAVLRSPYAHARIVAIDATQARAVPGVALVLTAADLGELNQPTPLLIPNPALTHPRTARPLAAEEGRYVGEPVARVVAESRYVAEDALEAIEVTWHALPVVANLDVARAERAPLVHADVPGNRAARLAQRVGDPDAVFAGAARVCRETLWIERSCGSPIETRGVVAEWDARAGTLRVWDATQAPLPIKNGLARMFGLPEFKVDVIAPDVGGGFGTKIMLFYPEEILVPLAAIRLGRPVKWIEDRHEHLIAANQERGQIHDVDVAVDGDGRILALRDRFVHDAGAYTPYGIIVPLITSTQLPGPYRLRHYAVEFDVVYTNTAIVTPYRGAGRPHGAFVMERVIGRVARELGLEAVEVRRRNFIQPHEFPWDVGLTFQDGGPTRYDSGDYPRGLEMALETIGFRDFRARQAEARRQGRHLGLGVACYVEGTGIGPYEGAHVRVEPSGRVLVATGLTTQGQGHATTFAQIADDALGCDPADVTVITGDTRRFNWGAGTFASRALVTSGNAVGVAARKVRNKALRIIKYAVHHDCGRMINPTIVEGQIRGGVAQGVGGALYERIVYDGEGQPLTTTFMDFLMPTAMEVPSIEIVHTETPSPLNPLGVKGVGEAGAIPGPALLAEAVDDALAPFGVRVREMPLGPDRLRQLIAAARRQNPAPPTMAAAGDLGWTIRRSAHFDSVALMRVAEQARQIPGVIEGTLGMGTPANLATAAA